MDNNLKLSLGTINNEVIQILDKQLIYNNYIFKIYNSSYIKNEFTNTNNKNGCHTKLPEIFQPEKFFLANFCKDFYLKK